MQHHSQDPGYSASPQPEIRFWRMQHNWKSTKIKTDLSALFMSEIESAKKELEDMVQDKLDRINQLSLENENLERHVNEKDEQLDDLNKKLKETEFKLENLNKDKNDFESQIELYKDEVDTLMKSNKSQSNIINDLREKLSELQAKYDTQFEMNENWSIEKEDLIQQKNDIQTELYNYMSRVSDLQIFKENFELEAKNKIEKYEETILNLNSNIDDKENLIDSLKEQLNELKEDFQSRLEAEIKQFEFVEDRQNSDLIKSYENQIESLKNEKENLKAELQSKESYEISQSLLDSKNEQIDELNEKIKILTTQIEENIQMNEDVQKKILNEKENFENEIKSLNENFKSEIDSLNEKIETLNREKCEIIAEHELKINENNDLNKLNEELSNKCEQITSENKTLKNDVETKLEDSKTKEEMIEQLNLEINELKNKLVDSDNKINMFKESLKDLKEKSQDQSPLEELRIKLEADNEVLSKEIKELKDHNDELKTNTDKIKTEFQQENTKLIITNENIVENDDLKRRQNELNNLITELEQKLEQIVEQNKTTLEQKLEELDSIHKQELENMNNLSANDIDKLKNEYEQQIEKLKEDHSRQLNEELERIRKQITAEYEKKIESLKDSYDAEDSDSVKLISEASISNENCKKLKEQIQLSKQLDQDIFGKVGQNLENGNDEVEERIPDGIREILDKLENEGVLLLTLSEILALKNHFKNKKSSPDLEKLSEQTEKDNLIKENYLLKEIIEKFSTENVKDDWRSSFLTTLSEIFSNQKDLLLSELRSYVCSGCLSSDENYLNHLEKKIDNSISLQQKSIDYLHSSDRESLVKEIECMQAQLVKVMNEINVLSENERERKRELKLMEYAKDSEIIKSNDLKQSLNLEKNKTFDLMEKLSQEKKKTNMMQEQLYELNEEVIKIKDLLNIDKELDKEKIKNEQLSKALEAKNKLSIQDENDYRSEYIRHDKIYWNN
ncbi:A-kinase anchor 9-like [Brachionus plicatilis]|uniref:A-kinase anchor 9-like n=1 Tax=Brachionus plicatilis TaxID=10195 RepID=A0A3M7PQ91_BRAPC|nr:A-kinase anchor 9-like [Brachionus plicatilis]